MILHLAVEGVAEGALGVGVDVVDAAARLVRAGLAPGPPPRHRVVSLDGRSVRSGAGRRIAVDGALAARHPRAGDVLVIPGLSAATEPAVDRLLARADTPRLIAHVRRSVERGAVVAASCSATFVLAAAGLLDGRQATTTWWLASAFARRFPRVALRSDRMLVEDDGVLTAGAAFAHADLMLAIVARVAGPSLAHLVARYLVLDERASQARYMVHAHLRSDDPAVRALERFVLANLGRQLSLDELARATATSPRTLARRVKAALGTSPQRFVQRLRVAQAAHLLDTTPAAVEEIAARVGYADGAAFRRAFRLHTGTTPRGRTTS